MSDEKQKVIDDGGPAFPVGVSMRDYFAGQALAGVFASGNSRVIYKIASDQCYAIADAMLEARKQQ